jgi:hypothetical protein
VSLPQYPSALSLTRFLWIQRTPSPPRRPAAFQRLDLSVGAIDETVDLVVVESVVVFGEGT